MMSKLCTSFVDQCKSVTILASVPCIESRFNVLLASVLMSPMVLLLVKVEEAITK